MKKIRAMRRETLRSVRLSVPILALSLGLAACGGMLSTASSIRVEVDVYKGPLSKELDIQWGELLGIAEEANDTLEQYRLSLEHIAMSLKDCKEVEEYIYPEGDSNSSTQTSVTNEETGVIYAADVTRDCLILNALNRDVAAIELLYENILKIDHGGQERITSCRPPISNNDICKPLRQTLRDLTQVATQLKVKALYWVNAEASAPTWSRTVRVFMTNFINLAAQYSNQLVSRSDAILKQLEGTKRELLPTSVYLRDTSPTEFPNLYAWNRAAGPALPEEMLLHPFHAFSTEETVDRIRVIEDLFADHYWSNVNTVYASGQGTVRMALIKDDIGNWNLKSFDSDPSELLEAYKELTLAGIEAAIRVAKSSVTGDADEAILDLASRLTRGRIAPEGVKAAAFNVEALHDRVADRLEKLQVAKKNKEEEIKNDPALDQTTRPQEQERLRRETLKEAQRIIEDHEAVIDVLQESVITGTPNT